LAKLDELLNHRRRQSQLMITLLADTPHIRPVKTVRFEDLNHQYPLFRLDISRPRDFSARLAALGILNSVGIFQLTAADQVPLFGRFAKDSCHRARNYIDTSLAVIVSQHHTEDQIRKIASVIDAEARAWPSG